MDHFGKTFLLENLTPRHASMFMASVKRVNALHQDKPLSDWSRARILRSAKAIFQTAVEWELMRRNPFKTLKSPQLVTKRWHYITPEEYKRLIDVASTVYWKAFYAVAYTAGLRFGELASLTWADIDFQKSEVHVCSKPGTATMPPFFVKDHEERTIPLPKHTLDILCALHAEAPIGMPYVLIDRDRYDLILKNWQQFQAEGRAWSNRNMINNVLRDFRCHAKRAGIRPEGVFNVHCLRKSCGQNWADHLPIHVVKELMGHSEISTTQKFYNQVEPYQRRKAATVMQNLVGKLENDNDPNASEQEGVM